MEFTVLEKSPYVAHIMTEYFPKIDGPIKTYMCQVPCRCNCLPRLNCIYVKIKLRHEVEVTDFYIN